MESISTSLLSFYFSTYVAKRKRRGEGGEIGHERFGSSSYQRSEALIKTPFILLFRNEIAEVNGNTCQNCLTENEYP